MISIRIFIQILICLEVVLLIKTLKTNFRIKLRELLNASVLLLVLLKKYKTLLYNYFFFYVLILKTKTYFIVSSRKTIKNFKILIQIFIFSLKDNLIYIKVAFKNSEKQFFDYISLPIQRNNNNNLKANYKESSI